MKLGAVREALLADARRDRDELLAAAERDAAGVLAAAQAEADRLVLDARTAGSAEAAAVGAAELAAARRAARETVLRARRETYDSTRRAARDAAASLRRAPGYHDLVTGLTRLAHDQLGDAAVITVDDDAGGVVARNGSCTVDYRLPAIADRCFDSLGAEVAVLWQ